MELVVRELSMDGVPNGVGSSFGNANNGADIFGHGVVEPTQDALIFHDPVRITAVVDGWRRGEVTAEAELPDEGVKEAAPFGVVRFGEVELDGDVRLDVDRLQDSRRRHGEDRSVEGGFVGNGARGGGIGVRLVELEVGIDVHDAGRMSSGESSSGGRRRRRRATVAEGRRAGSSCGL